MKILFSRCFLFIVAFFVISHNADCVDTSINQSIIQNQQNFDKIMKEINKIIDEIEKKNVSIADKNNDKNVKQNKDIKDNYKYETYAGMVGDKRNDKGLNLDITMEPAEDGVWDLCIEGNEINNEKLIKQYLQKNLLMN